VHTTPPAPAHRGAKSTYDSLNGTAGEGSPADDVIARCYGNGHLPMKARMLIRTITYYSPGNDESRRSAVGAGFRLVGPFKTLSSLNNKCANIQSDDLEYGRVEFRLTARSVPTGD